MGTETMLIVGAVVSIATTAISMYASYEQGQAQAQAQKNVYRYQAALAENQAVAERQAAEVRAQEARERKRRLLSSTRAAAAASGIEVDEGSPGDVLLDNATQAELAVARARYGGELGAFGATQQASMARYQARLAGAAAPSLGATLLTGFGRAAQQVYPYARDYFGRPAGAA